MFIAVIHALYIFSLFKLHADSISAITDIGMTYPSERGIHFRRMAYPPERGKLSATTPEELGKNEFAFIICIRH